MEGTAVRARVLLLVVVVAAACERRQQDAARPAPSVLASEVRARVNGVSITGDEVALWLAGPHGTAKSGSPLTPEQALEDLIDLELMAQRAQALGHRVEGGPAADGGADAVLGRATRRQSLAKQFRMKELLLKAVVTPEEARAWFDANAAWVRSELEVQSMRVAGREAVGQAQGLLASGKSFEEVAATVDVGRGAEPRPGVAKRLRWSQVPPPWRAELERLTAGKISGPIADGAGGFWLLKLLGRNEDPAVTFESAGPAVQAWLTAQKFEQQRESVVKELRGKAKIERLSK